MKKVIHRPENSLQRLHRVSQENFVSSILTVVNYVQFFKLKEYEDPKILMEQGVKRGITSNKKVRSLRNSYTKVKTVVQC